jgi:hypothetical protein
MDIFNLGKNMTHHTVHKNDEGLMNFLNISKYNAVVAGGAALRWYQNLPVESHDVDIWFTCEEDFNTMDEYLKMNSTIRYSSQYANTYDVHEKSASWTVQLIKPKKQLSPAELVKTFDISISQVATDGNRWFIGSHFIEDLKNRRLRILNPQPKSVKRLVKYLIYGFVPDDDQLLAVINDPTTIWNYETINLEDYDQ